MAHPTKPGVDYSLYLVTGRELLPPGKDYYESLEEALQGGVTLVQVREKNVDTGEVVSSLFVRRVGSCQSQFIDVARRTKAITDKYGVPLIINDRIDVHLAVGSAGIHIGQTDCPLAQARALVGHSAIIGVSVSSPAEAGEAAAGGADYIGVGPVWDTSSKDLKGKRSLGPEGVGAALDALASTGVQAVAIGGIHLPNLPHLLHGSISPVSRKGLDGIALISDIVASTRPQAAAEGLRRVVDSFKRVRGARQGGEAVFLTGHSDRRRTIDRILETVTTLMVTVRTKTPLIHQITNNVVINDSANATIAVGASPIMATNPRDVVDLSPAIGALLVNIGTISDREGMMLAGRQANVNRKPVVYDPVGVGATSFRRDTTAALLAHWQPTVIKGNASEIGALAESSEVSSRGVDSASTGFTDPASVVKALARKRAAVIVLTGVSDYLSDGEIVLKTSNGHHLLGSITGSGCMTGSLIATFCAAARLHHLATEQPYEEASQLVQGDMLVGALAGVLVFNVAAEIAASRPDVRGPGTFRSALLDELYNLTPEEVMTRAKVELVG